MLTGSYKSLHIEEIRRRIRKRIDKYVEAMYGTLFLAMIGCGYGASFISIGSKISIFIGLFLLVVGALSFFIYINLMNTLLKKGFHSATPRAMDVFLLSAALANMILSEYPLAISIAIVLIAEALVGINHLRRQKTEYKLWFFKIAREYIHEVRKIKAGVYVHEAKKFKAIRQP